MNCSHQHIYDGACVECGMEVFGTSSGTHIEMNSKYSEHHSFIDPQNTQPFEADLKNLNIPIEIKTMVMNLANSCPRETHRMGVRRQQLFAYIYLAYLQTGFKFDPEKIREEMKMTQREVNMALRIISGTSSVDIPLPVTDKDEPISAPVVVISPLVYIEDVCENNGIKDHTETVLELTKKVLDKNKILLEFNPKHMAVAIVKYYMNGINVNIPKFVKLNGISDSILKQHIVRITKTLEG
jgi:hypothetical protein